METQETRRQAALQALTQVQGSIGGQPIALLLLDLDHFQEVNERYGHEIGDRVLEAVAAAAQSQLEPGDRLVRSGGDEYAAIVPGRDLSAAQETAAKICAAIAGDPFLADKAIKATVGLAMSQPQETAAEWLARADRASRTGKRDGRNCVRVAS